MIKRYKSPLRWPGGKSRALKRLRELMPDLSQVKDYREPFVGGGSVFLYIKSELAPGSYVWINDLFKPLFRFWMVCQNDNWEIVTRVDMARTFLDPKQMWDNYRTVPVEEWTGTDLFIINRCAYSGNVCGGYSEAAATSRFTSSAIDRIRDMEEPLRDTVITCQDYEKVVTASGSPKETFIFLDPPYHGIKGLYKVGGAGEFDHLRLEFVLRKCRYPFMLTYNDCPEIRELYNWADIQPFEIQYGMDNVAGNKPKKGRELIIRNYG